MKKLAGILLLGFTVMLAWLSLSGFSDYIDGTTFERTTHIGSYNDKHYIYTGGASTFDYDLTLYEVSKTGSKIVMEYKTRDIVKIFENKLFVFGLDHEADGIAYMMYYLDLDDLSRHEIDLGEYAVENIKFRSYVDNKVILEVFYSGRIYTTFLIYDLSSNEVVSEFEIGPMSFIDSITYIIDNCLYIHISFHGADEVKLYKVDLDLGELEVVISETNPMIFAFEDEFHFIIDSVNGMKSAFVLDIEYIDKLPVLLSEVSGRFSTHTLDNKLYVSYDGVVDVYNNKLELIDSFDSDWDYYDVPSIIGENQFVVIEEGVYGILDQTEYATVKVYDLETGKYIYESIRFEIGSRINNFSGY